MMTAAALSAALLLAAEPGDRVLLCRPTIQGETGLAKADALAAAGRTLGGRFLDYGVPCEGDAEAARAAGRAGLGHAVSAVAEGRTEGSRFQLALCPADGSPVRARRSVEVAPGGDAVPSLRQSLEELLGALPRPPGSRIAPWMPIAAGAALLAVGAGSALVARQSGQARDRAGARGDWAGYVRQDASWRRWRVVSGVAWGLGGTTAAVGIAWKLAF